MSKDVRVLFLFQMNIYKFTWKILHVSLGRLSKLSKAINAKEIHNVCIADDHSNGCLLNGFIMFSLKTHQFQLNAGILFCCA